MTLIVGFGRGKGFSPVVPPAAAPAYQVIPGRGTSALGSSAGTRYAPLYSANAWTNTEANIQQLTSAPGTLSYLHVKLAPAPGAGKSWTFTVMVNGAPSSLACTISDTETEGEDTANTATLAPGDAVSLKATFSGSPPDCYSRWACIFTGDGERVSILPGGTATNSRTETRYNQLAGVCPFDTMHRGEAIPTAGVLRDLYIKLSGAPGAGDSFVFTVMVNEVPSSLACTISGGVDTTGHNTKDAVVVALGDIVELRSTPVGTPTARNVQWGTTFLADKPRESLILGDHSLLNTKTSYLPLAAGLAGTSLTEDRALEPLLTCSLSNFYVSLTIAPSPGTSFTTTVRKNGADTALAVTISDEDTEGSYTASAVDYHDGDDVCLKVVPQNHPNIPNASWGVLVKW